ncbi:hypothetical protein JCM33374_g4578 [Metschnikowia sp. JCM 33374]|nr:hypothetical protein JCM33374_g4578 [Metschnikowia sp. JCM 33374]
MSQPQNPGVQTPKANPPAPGPVLSFKKRKNKAPLSQVKGGPQDKNEAAMASSPEVSNSSTSTSGAGTPIAGGPRKVSTRRKALQDFYKLHSSMDVSTSPTVKEHIGLGLSKDEPEAAETTQRPEQSDHVDPEKLLESLKDEKSMQEFVQSATSREILRARNAAADRHILNDVFAGKQSVSEFSHAEDESTVTNSSIDEYLADLSQFLQTDGGVFNQDFASVVETVCSQVDGADSVSSVAGIVGEK